MSQKAILAYFPRELMEDDPEMRDALSALWHKSVKDAGAVPVAGTITWEVLTYFYLDDNLEEKPTTAHGPWTMAWIRIRGQVIWSK
jgi:hypothetical protein